MHVCPESQEEGNCLEFRGPDLVGGWGKVRKASPGGDAQFESYRVRDEVSRHEQSHVSERDEPRACCEIATWPGTSQASSSKSLVRRVDSIARAVGSDYRI